MSLTKSQLTQLPPYSSKDLRSFYTVNKSVTIKKEVKMIQVSKNIFIEGFENQQTFDDWLKQQDEQMPKTVMLKMFKWFLMRLEDNAKENKFNKKVMEGIDKYSKRVIENKIMQEDDVIKYIRLAIGWEETT